MPMLLDEVETCRALHKERGDVYGDVHQGHEQLGRMWAAILSVHFHLDLGDIPEHIVSLMMCAMKLQRASKKFTKDHYLDAMNYLDFAYDGCMIATENTVNSKATSK